MVAMPENNPVKTLADFVKNSVPKAELELLRLQMKPVQEYVARLDAEAEAAKTHVEDDDAEGSSDEHRNQAGTG